VCGVSQIGVVHVRGVSEILHCMCDSDEEPLKLRMSKVKLGPASR
jgi:hypothetical protein